MNWVLGLTAGIFLICIIVGICRGAIKITVSLISTIITIALVFCLTPFVSKMIYSKTPADEVVQHQVEKMITELMNTAALGTIENASGGNGPTEDTVRNVLNAAGVTEDKLAEMGITVEDIVSGKVSSEKLAQYGISKSILDGLYSEAGALTEEVTESADIPKELQIRAIENSGVPNVWKELLLNNNNDTVYGKLGAENFISYVVKFMSNMIVNIVAFLFTFLIVTIVLRAIIFALDIVSELPGVGFINRMAGGVLGAIGALIIVWLIFLAVTLFYTTSVGKTAIDMIQENEILIMIYENNPLLKLASMVR